MPWHPQVGIKRPSPPRHAFDVRWKSFIMATVVYSIRLGFGLAAGARFERSFQRRLEPTREPGACQREILTAVHRPWVILSMMKIEWFDSRSEALNFVQKLANSSDPGQIVGRKI